MPIRVRGGWGRGGVGGGVGTQRRGARAVVAPDYKRSITRGYKGYKGLQGVTRVTRGDKGYKG